MSRTTDHFITLMEATEEISCLHDALKLEVDYDTSKGTSTRIQDHFRELKYKYITEALKKYDLFDSVHHYYNYSMQGLVQLFFDDEPIVLTKLEANKEALEDTWRISLDDCIEQRHEAIVLTISIPESNLTHKK
ncbi:MAG: hypothetical protein IJF83_07165 [Methanobrevibacter sp.]|nr:hypothetical protein [Methanobrevibacter sp.]